MCSDVDFISFLPSLVISFQKQKDKRPVTPGCLEEYERGKCCLEGNVLGDLISTQKAAMRRMACNELLAQCPELAIIQSFQDLWPLSAAIQPRWINSIHYKRLKTATEAEKLELIELRRNACLVYQHLKTL
ncbi:hypothetical protein BDB01DRAFT_833942 [Pilobolus umbonatus]|nr:hypothetical protein BDB01DRAFT_833942 [Pilobolus umbonatus]